MRRRCKFRRFVIFGLALALVPGLYAPARAVIEVLTPLQNFITDATWIAVAKVEKIAPDGRAAILTLSQELKGKADFSRRTVGLVGESKQESADLALRITVDTPLVVFFCQREKEDGGDLILAYTNGTWLRLYPRGSGEDKRWVFGHFESYLRRSYKDPTDDLHRLVVDVVAGKAAAPQPNEKEKPGIGPPLAAEWNKPE